MAKIGVTGEIKTERLKNFLTEIVNDKCIETYEY